VKFCIAMTITLTTYWSDGNVFCYVLANRNVNMDLTTTAVRIRSQVRSSGMCDVQSGTGADFFRVLRFPLPVFILLHIH
jgi:hypothetical protein